MISSCPVRCLRSTKKSSRLSVRVGVVVALIPSPSLSPAVNLRPKYRGAAGRVARTAVPQEQEVYMSDSHLYMAMDLITGGNLAGGYRCEGEEQAAAVVRQIVRALRYLHDRNIAVNAMI